MKKMVYILVLTTLCFGKFLLTTEPRGTKRPVPFDLGEPILSKKPKIEHVSRVATLKDSVLDLLVQKLFTSIIDLAQHEQQQWGSVKVSRLLSDFFNQSSVVWNNLPLDLQAPILFDVLLRTVLMGNVLTVQETNQLLAMLLSPQEFIKDLDSECTKMLTQSSLLGESQKQMLAFIKKFFAENMIATHQEKTITINTVLTGGKTLLAQTLDLIATEKWYRYFSREATAIDFFNELVQHGADINAISYTPHVNAPLYYFAMNQAVDIEKITSLLIKGGLQVAKPDTVNNLVITPLRVLLIMAYPDTLRRRGYLDTVEKLKSFLDKLYMALLTSIISLPGQTLDIDRNLKDINECKEKLLTLSEVEAEKKDILLAWYKTIIELLQSIKPHEELTIP